MILRKNLSVAAMMIFIFVLFTGCGDNYVKISHDEAQKMMDENKDAIILDVRTLEEFDKKHIPNALLVPIDDLRNGNFSSLPDKDAMIIIYCHTGRRSEEAAKILVNAGYKNVYDMGDIVDWTGSISGTKVK